MVLKPRQLHILLFLLCCLGFASLGIILNKDTHNNYFELLNTRINFPERKLDNDIDLKIFKDFFRPDTFGRLVDYNIHTGIFIDEKNPSLIESLNSKLNDALIDTLMGNIGNDIETGAIFDPFFIKKIVNVHKKTLSENNIQTAKLQTDLYFTPSVSKSFNFDTELSSNMLINHSEEIELNDFIHSNEITNIQKIYTLKIPSNGNTYQYLGGVISIWSDSNNFKFTPTEINKDTVSEGEFNGYVRYRRYFRVNRLTDLDLTISQPDFNLNMIHFKSENFQEQPIITVDILRSFDQKTVMPKLDRMDIHFGEIVPSKFFTKEIGLQVLEDHEQPIITGSLFLKGDTPKTRYKAHLKKLSWSFKDEFFSNNSQIVIELIKPSYEMNYGQLKNEIRSQILLKNAPSLIKTFKLSRFHKVLNFEDRK